MFKKIFLIPFFACCALANIGCNSDPFVGKWVGTLDPSVNLMINAEDSNKYSGHGNVYFNSALCPFELNGEKYSEKVMKASFSFYKTGIQTCTNASINNIECDISSDDYLKCQIPDGTLLVYTKKYETTD